MTVRIQMSILDMRGTEKRKAYAKFRWQSTKYKTQIAHDENPQCWSDRFIINVDSQKKTVLKLELWAKTWGVGSFVGQTELDLKPVLNATGAIEGWYKLNHIAIMTTRKVELYVKLQNLDAMPNVGTDITANRNMQSPQIPMVYPGNTAYQGNTMAPPQQYPPQQYPPQQYPPQQYPPPNMPVAVPYGVQQAAAPYGGDPFESFCHIKQMLPHIADPSIWHALQASNYNRDAAMDSLLKHNGSAPPSDQMSGYPEFAAYVISQPPQPAMMQPQQYGYQMAPVVAPPSGAISHGSGRKKALMVGINYFGARSQLNGCIADVARMKQLLMTHYGYQDGLTSFVCLTDDNPDPKFQPTRFNIIYGMQWLVKDAMPGDILFFHYSGHGSQVKDSSGYELDGLDEVILPVDHIKAGHIADDEMHTIMVQNLPAGTRLIAVMDCCHSGTGLDLPYVFNKQSSDGWMEDFCPFYSAGDVQLFSGCCDDQKAAEIANACQKGGAVTTAMVNALTANPHGHTYNSLNTALNDAMKRSGYRHQHPQLSSTQRFDLNRPFNFVDIVPNYNQYYGRKVQKTNKEKKKWKKKKMGRGAMAGMVLAGGMGALLIGDLLNTMM